MKYLHIDCACQSPSHSIKLTDFSDKVDGVEVSIDYQLHSMLSFWERLKVAFNLIVFNQTSNSIWQNVILNDKQIDFLVEFLQEAQKNGSMAE